jgi:hypothetical protein
MCGCLLYELYCFIHDPLELFLCVYTKRLTNTNIDYYKTNQTVIFDISEQMTRFIFGYWISCDTQNSRL